MIEVKFSDIFDVPDGNAMTIERRIAELAKEGFPIKLD